MAGKVGRYQQQCQHGFKAYEVQDACPQVGTGGSWATAGAGWGRAWGEVHVDLVFLIVVLHDVLNGVNLVDLEVVGLIVAAMEVERSGGWSGRNLFFHRIVRR